MRTASHARYPAQRREPSSGHADSHADEGPIALALIARAVPVTTVFDIDGVAAAQEEIVPVHGKSSVSPETRPGADLSREAGQRGGSTGFGGLGSALGSR